LDGGECRPLREKVAGLLTAGGLTESFSQAADGTGAVERLTRSPNVQQSTGVSPDGTRLIFAETAPATSEDVMQVELIGTRTITALVQSSFAERNGIISPDGRWLAYEANDSGQLRFTCGRTRP
jgi:Tol biopolymer transport system component